MKALLTGYKGFIGKALEKKLQEIYDVVYCFDIEDCWSPELVAALTESDIVFHVGAISDTSLQDEAEMMTFNYTFSKTLFNLCQSMNKKVVYSSSAACYGDGVDDQTPLNIYGWSKLVAEDYGMAKCDNFVALRYFNVYGPGECHKGKMASVANQAHKKGQFRIFQKEPKRDFVYIQDVVDANIHAIEAPKGVYEVGSGEARTFEDVLSIMGVRRKYHHLREIPKWYQFYTRSNSEKWMPNWKPKYTIDKGLVEYKKYLDDVRN